MDDNNKEMNNNLNQKSDVERLTEKINDLFNNDKFYTTAKMEGYLSKVGDIGEIAKNAMDRYKSEYHIKGELTPDQVEEVAVKYDQELKKSIEMDRASKGRANENENPKEKNDNDNDTVNKESGKEEEQEI